MAENLKGCKTEEQLIPELRSGQLRVRKKQTRFKEETLTPGKSQGYSQVTYLPS